MRTPTRTSTRLRTHSENVISIKKNRVMTDTATSVSSLRLTNTRSYTCNMYNVGASIIRLATPLNRPTSHNSR